MSESWATSYANVQTVLRPIVQWLTMRCPIIKMLDNALSNCPMVGQCCVQHSNGWSMLCPTVRWLVSWVSNSPMVEVFFVQLSNGRTVLCPNVLRSESALSNCPMVGQCCVQQSNGYSMLCQTVPAECSIVQWMAWALSKCPIVTVLFQTVQCLDSAVFSALNCLGGCINIF